MANTMLLLACFFLLFNPTKAKTQSIDTADLLNFHLIEIEKNKDVQKRRDSSYHHLSQAYELLKHGYNDSLFFHVTTNLSFYHSEFGNKKESRKMLNVSLELAKKLANRTFEMICYGEIAHSYSINQDANLDSAQYYHYKAKNLARLTRDTFHEALFAVALAGTNLDFGIADQNTLDQLNFAYQLKDFNVDTERQTMLWELSYGRFYCMNENFDLSNQFFEKSYKKSKRLESDEYFMAHLLKLWTSCLEEQKEYKKASHYLKELSELNTSLQKYNQSAHETEMEVLAQKKENEIQKIAFEKELESVKRKRNKYFAFIVTFALFLITTVAYFLIKNYRLRAADKEKLIEVTRALSDKEKQVLKSEFDAKLSKLEMDVLRAQMNPHFLFNTLNSIKSYVLFKDPEETAVYINKFSTLIRKVLENSRSDMVSLEDEVLLLKSYIEIERIRFKQKFDYTFIVDPSIDMNRIEIPPMIIQPFIENAIWHGLMHKDGEKNLTINFTQENAILICEVRDNGVGRDFAKKISKDRTHKRSLGIEITKDRLNNLQEVTGIDVEYKVDDLYNEDGSACGTRVLLSFKNLAA